MRADRKKNVERGQNKKLEEQHKNSHQARKEENTKDPKDLSAQTWRKTIRVRKVFGGKQPLESVSLHLFSASIKWN